MELVSAAQGVELGMAGFLLLSMPSKMEVTQSQRRTTETAPMRLKMMNRCNRTRRFIAIRNEGRTEDIGGWELGGGGAGGAGSSELSVVLCDI